MNKKFLIIQALLGLVTSCTVLAGSIYACTSSAPQTVSKLRISPSQLIPSGLSSGTLKLNGRTHQISDLKNRKNLRLRKGVNRLIISGNGCNLKDYIVASPRMFFRKYGSDTTGDLRFTRIISNPVGMEEPMSSASDISESIRETTPAMDPEITLGQAFFAQIIDHDLTENNQFQNGPSTDPDTPRNLHSPLLDLDNVYGFGRNVDSSSFENHRLYFKLINDSYDVPRTADGVALIPDKRDDITGPTLQLHILLKKYHNFLMDRYRRKTQPGKLTRKQRKWLFELVRNEVIGTYQSIVINEISNLLTGRKLPTDDYPALNNITVEFAAAGYRIGHTLIPNEIIIDKIGTTRNPTDHTLRGPARVNIPWTLLLGDAAQKAGRFDDQVSPAMQELIIPLSPSNPHLTDLVGGGANNIGGGRIVEGTLRLDIVETNILRSREQGLPTGEEVLAQMNNAVYTPGDGSTDLFLYILQEALANNFKYGEVGRMIFEKTISGILNVDRYALETRNYSNRDRKRYSKRTLEWIARKAFPNEWD